MDTPPNDPNAPPPPEPGYLVGPDGAFREGWRDSLPEALRQDKTLAAVTDFPTMAEMLVNAEKTIGKKRAVLPAGPDDTEALDSYFRHLGWPETPDGYAADAELYPLPEGLEDQPEVQNAWRGWCHEARLTPPQFAALTTKMRQWSAEEAQRSSADRAEALEKARTELRQRWGTKYDLHTRLAQTAVNAFTDEGELAHARAAGWLDDPVFLSLMQKVGSAVSPDRLHARADGTPDPGAVRRQIEDKMASEAYQNAKDPRHNAVQEEVRQLFEQLHKRG